MIRKRFRSYFTARRSIVCILIFVLLYFASNMKRLIYDQMKSNLPKSALKFINFEETYYVKTFQKDNLRRLIAKCNRDERIVNMDVYGPVKAEAPVLVIFVDKYKANLKYLLASLQHVGGIADALIIFSHSYFDENVNNLIKTIDFARVLQIFYPYSLQIYTEEFPGFQSGDCLRDTSMYTATKINCVGAYSPDIHGYYRDPLLSQGKHFWWWTMNHIFEKLSHTKKHTGIFIFLEDDVYLLEDFIFMTLQLKNVSKFVFQCDLVALDSTKDPFFRANANGAHIKTWDPTQHTSVLAFDSSVWNSISAHYYLFCHVDDYSWARSLFYLSLNRRDGNRFRVISSTMPRAYKTSTLSSVGPFLEYNILEIVLKILDMENRNSNLYPSQLEVYLDIELDYDEFVIFDYVDNNGGWSDPRDKAMCYNNTANKVKKIIMEMDTQFNNYKSDDDFDPEFDDGEEEDVRSKKIKDYI